jgi:hypothetical protein
VLTAGAFSGYLTIDPAGSWNGTTFTYIVNDTNPHFFYSVSSFYSSNCSYLGYWSTYYSFSSQQDVLFALNPVSPMKFFYRRVEFDDRIM